MRTGVLELSSYWANLSPKVLKLIFKSPTCVLYWANSDINAENTKSKYVRGVRVGPMWTKLVQNKTNLLVFKISCQYIQSNCVN